jgi:hypothetical protein
MKKFLGQKSLIIVFIYVVHLREVLNMGINIEVIYVTVSLTEIKIHSKN